MPDPTSGQNPIVLDAQRRYHEAIEHAHDRYSAFVNSALQAVFASPSPTSAPESSYNPLDVAKSQYSEASSLALSSLAAVVASASMASAGRDTAQSVIEDASSRYSAALSAASASLSLASASASSAVHETPTGSPESVTVQMPENWDSLILKASEQVYGTPTPSVQQILNQPVAQYEAIKGLVSDLLAGKDPAYTESVMSRLRAVYETPYPASALSSASSYASNAYETASSVASAYVTPLPAIEDMLNSANDQLTSAVHAASVYVYGSSEDTNEQATPAASSYLSESSQMSEAIYDTQPESVENARGSMEEASSSTASASENF